MGWLYKQCLRILRQESCLSFKQHAQWISEYLKYIPNPYFSQFRPAYPLLQALHLCFPSSSNTQVSLNLQCKKLMKIKRLIKYFKTTQVKLLQVQNSQENACARVSFLIKLLAEGGTSSKERLWHRCFLVNFAKILGTPFLRTTPGGCFCLNTVCQFHSYSIIAK